VATGLIDLQFRGSRKLTSFFEFLVHNQITTSEDEAIAIFKLMLPSQGDRTVDRHQFFEFFESKAELLPQTPSKQLLFTNQQLVSFHKQQSTYYEDFSFESEYNVFKNSPEESPPPQKPQISPFAEGKENKEQNYRSKIQIQKKFEEGKLVLKQHKHDNRHGFTPALKIVDLSDKTLPSDAKASIKAKSNPKQRRMLLRPEGQNIKKEERKRGQKREVSTHLSRTSKESGSQDSTNTKSRSECNPQSPQALQSLSKYIVTDCARPASAHGGDSKWLKRAQFQEKKAGLESPPPPTAARVHQTPTSRQNSRKKSKSKIELQSCSTRASSLKKQVTGTGDSNRPPNPVLELCIELMRRETLLELVKGQLCSCKDFNLERLFGQLGTERQGFVTPHSILRLLESLSDEADEWSYSVVLQTLFKGKSTLTFALFCEFFFPLSKHMIAKMKDKMTTLAPQFDSPLSTETRAVLWSLFACTAQLWSIKAKHRDAVNSSSVEVFRQAVQVGGSDRRSVLSLFEAYPALSLYSDDVKAKVAGLLGWDRQEGVNWGSLRGFLAGN
jgi:hypothetical protein